LTGGQFLKNWELTLSDELDTFAANSTSGLQFVSDSGNPPICRHPELFQCHTDLERQEREAAAKQQNPCRR
jgi:hypothetical protein